MFYILNFDTHEFISCDNANAVEAKLRDAMEQGSSEDSFEIINGFAEECRFDVSGFRSYCESLNLTDETTINKMVTAQQEKAQEECDANKDPKCSSSCSLELPDGSILRAKAFSDTDFPAINIYWENESLDEPDLVCFAEYNPERSKEHHLCVGVYRSDEDDTVYYNPYIADKESLQAENS